MKASATKARPPEPDDDEGLSRVISFAIGGLQDWRPLEASIAAQLLEMGVPDGQARYIRTLLQLLFLKWCPGRAILINEEDRKSVLPMVEELTSMMRQTTNGIFFELMKREIESRR